MSSRPANAPNASEDSDVDPRRSPPVTANLGQACYFCLAEGSPQNPLSRCGCLHVWYCNAECQKAQLSLHRKFCSAYKAVEKNYGREILRPFAFVAKDPVSYIVTNGEDLDECLDHVTTFITSKLEEELGRPLRSAERNIVGWEPRCLACGLSEMIFRIMAQSRNEGPPYPKLKPCPDCALSFYCSDEHWAAVKHIHQNRPCRDGYAGISQCQLNKFCSLDAKFSQVMKPGSNVGEFCWVPRRILPAWSSLRDLTWSDYQSDLAQAFSSYSSYGHPFLNALVRAASETLSMPMTILWALEIMNLGDISWTQKDVLNIHVLGAAGLELLHIEVFEEILHRVPLVQTLKLTFIGPALLTLTGEHPIMNEMEICSQCTRTGRKVIFDSYATTYHNYINDQGSQFERPDLAVAFNSVCGLADIESWTRSYHALWLRGIPSIFTAYNFEEAELESVLFKGAGIQLISEFGPRPNPWGSQLSKIEPSAMALFFSVNRWISGGFRGRRT
ncbi:hypothetical protein CPB84DRAFT_1735214 [Gymnopilus junonius]|uniref:MYND-type domain-containing protein n=1 Tax=Gymnopilus junonius TaxID=109634 RepID=A0A9P5NC62_GYMJU|nr:hypothetical protein CPB84DRAFT_1735214 [Gymnopilus junonius]